LDGISVRRLLTTLARLWTFLCHWNTCVLDKHSSSYALFSISNVSVPAFFNFTHNLIAALFHFETFNTEKKRTSPKQL
jgi:hypothetical protein